MIERLYVIALDHPYRLTYDSPVARYPKPHFYAAYRNREEAMRVLLTLPPPIEHNPFLNTDSFQKDEKTILTFCWTEIFTDQWMEKEISFFDFCSSLKEIGIIDYPSPGIAQENNFLLHADWKLVEWWERDNKILTETQKTAVWNLTCPFPYEIIEVELS